MVRFENQWKMVVGLKHKDAKDVDLKEVGCAVEELACELVKKRRDVSVKGVKGAPDWHGFETDLWKITEELREFYRKNRKLRGINPLSDTLARLAENASLGKGRQNLVLMLGEFGRGEYGAVLGRLLDDSDVYGHAIKALIRGKVDGYRERIAAILESEKTGWINKAARKYVAFSDSGDCFEEAS